MDRTGNWLHLDAGVLVGLVDVGLVAGVVLRGCRVCRQGDHQWVDPPRIPVVDRDGVVTRVPGKTVWQSHPAAVWMNRPLGNQFSREALADLRERFPDAAAALDTPLPPRPPPPDAPQPAPEPLPSNPEDAA